MNNCDHPATALWCEACEEFVTDPNARDYRAAYLAAGVKPIKRLSRAERVDTPIAFRDVLISIARAARKAV